MNRLARFLTISSIFALFTLINPDSLHAGGLSITSLSPNTGSIGASITVSGSGFGNSQGSSTVKFNGTLATTINSWSSSAIVAIVPSGATTGNVVVTVSGKASNGI